MAVTLPLCFQVARGAISRGVQLAARSLGSALPLNQQVLAPSTGRQWGWRTRGRLNRHCFGHCTDRKAIICIVRSRKTVFNVCVSVGLNKGYFSSAVKSGYFLGVPGGEESSKEVRVGSASGFRGW